MSIFNDIVKRLTVLYNATPEDKLLLNVGLKETGAVIAATGECMDDSGPIRIADVGYALNFSSMLVKESADVVLLDDSI